jgi:maleamate amidohydrolase
MSEISARQNYQGVFDRQLSAGVRPAVLVIDFIRAYTDPASPLHAPAVREAVRATMPLLAAARERGLPVIYTKVLYHPNGQDGGLFVRKVPALRGMVAGAALAEIVPELPPRADDLVLVKQYASAFFATSLAATLTARGIDTLLIAGCSTSGCVRASAVDCMQHGFVPLVVRDCVGDRHEAPHEANLFDIQAKYGEVIPLDAALAYVASVVER